MNGPRWVLVACVLGIAVLSGMIVWSSLEMNIVAGLRSIFSTGWGITTMVDVYLGFAFVSAWIACVERSGPRAAAWIVALLLLGNVVTLLYVALRARRARTVGEIFIPAPKA